MRMSTVCVPFPNTLYTEAKKELDTALSGVNFLEPVVPAWQVAVDLPAPQMLPSMQLLDASTCGSPAEGMVRLA
jgi:hypothetical protein